MLRVLHLGKFYPPVAGGIERVVQTLCAVTRGQLDNRVLAFNRDARTVEEVLEGVQVTRVATWATAGSVPVAPALAAHLRRAQCDIVVLHEPNPWALLAARISLPPVPLVVWFHSEVVRPRLQYRLCYAPLARPTYRRASRFIVASPAVAETARALAPYRQRVEVIPYGVDAERWAACDRPSRQAEIRGRAAGPILLFAGRLVPYKGLDVLIEAVAPLPVTLLVAGDGPMRPAWEQLARTSAGAAQVVFMGEVPDDELRAALHACDAFVLPSVTPAEAFGFVQLEAMACGKPVVSTRLASGVPWVNQDGVTGLVVPPGDVAALRAAVVRLLGDTGMRARLGRAGAQRVRQTFSLEAMRDRFVDVCRSLAPRTARIAG